MGKQPAVRIDLVRWQRQHGFLDLDIVQAFERGEEEAGVRGDGFNVSIRWNDGEDCRPRRGGGGIHRLRRAGEAADTTASHTHPQTAGGRFQNRAQRE